MLMSLLGQTQSFTRSIPVDLCGAAGEYASRIIRKRVQKLGVDNVRLTGGWKMVIA
jgi:hypothetical protein